MAGQRRSPSAVPVGLEVRLVDDARPAKLLDPLGCRPDLLIRQCVFLYAQEVALGQFAPTAELVPELVRRHRDVRRSERDPVSVVANPLGACAVGPLLLGKTAAVFTPLPPTLMRLIHDRNPPLQRLVGGEDDRHRHDLGLGGHDPDASPMLVPSDAVTVAALPFVSRVSGGLTAGTAAHLATVDVATRAVSQPATADHPVSTPLPRVGLARRALQGGCSWLLLGAVVVLHGVVVGRVNHLVLSQACVTAVMRPKILALVFNAKCGEIAEPQAVKAAHVDVPRRLPIRRVVSSSITSTPAALCFLALPTSCSSACTP